MKKPDGYDEVQAATAGESQTLPPGGYVCEIRQASISESKSGNEMLVLCLDISEGEFKGFYKAQFSDRTANNSTNAEAKWGCVYRQLTGGSSTRFFKGLITSIEESNESYKWNWNEATLKGKKIGAVFGREQYENNKSELVFSTKPMHVCSVSRIQKGEFKVPEDKLLNGAKSSKSKPSSPKRETPDYPDDDIDESDLPF
ncbi:hypothetical protein AGMMS49975_28250 [Clostridia bacterium]|nr:hypothetical protein AGMMS49975_28250 [Clostridia bacterium]